MKKQSILIAGVVAMIGGIFLIMMAQMEIKSNYRYSWTQPYTPYEAEILALKALGIIIFIGGLLAELFVAYQMYNSSNAGGGNNDSVSTIVCPNCGTKINKGIAVCPRCKKSVNGKSNKFR